MKNEKISLEIATLKKALLKDMPKVVKAKIEAKIVALEKELKGSTQTGVEFAKSLLSGKRKVKAMAKVDFNSLIKSLSKKPEYDFLKYLTRKQIEDDLDREAKPVGYRYVGRKNFKIPTKADIKAKRGVYYENRSNKSDVNRSVRLAKGGDARGEFGTFVYEIYGNGILKEERIVKAGYSNLIKEMAINMSKEYTNPSVRVRKLSKKEYEDGGMMAKGGDISKKLEVGVYRVGKPIKVVTNLYEQKIVEIGTNGDIYTASDYARNLSEFKRQKYDEYPMITLEQLEYQYKIGKPKMAKGGSLKGNFNMENNFNGMSKKDLIDVLKALGHNVNETNFKLLAKKENFEFSNGLWYRNDMANGGEIGGME